MTKAMDDWAKMPLGRVITDEEMHRRTHPAWPYNYFIPASRSTLLRLTNFSRAASDVHIHGATARRLAARTPDDGRDLHRSFQGRHEGPMVFKDHHSMTNNVATVIQDFLDRMAADLTARGEESFTPVQVFGGTVLNYAVGGMNIEQVKTALDYDRCKEIWLPSLDAAHQKEAQGYDPAPYIRVSDCAGTLTPEMIEILEIMAEYNDNAAGERVVLSACHVSNEEKFDILDYINRKGLDVKVLMDHVTQEMTVVTPDEAKQMIDMGAYLEFAECSCVPWPGMFDWVVAVEYSFNLIKELIKEKGTDNLVLITDAGQPGNEPIPGWKNFIKTLLAQGVSESEINAMLKEVPAMLLGKI